MRRLVRQLLERAVLCVGLGALTTVVVAWLLAALLPHRHLTIRHNVIQSTDGAGKLRYIATYEFRRAGMVRLMWQPGIGGPGWPLAKAALEKDAALQLRPHVEQDRSWGNLPAALLPGAAPSSGMEDARGWPLRALWCSLDAAAIDAGNPARPVVGGFRLSRNGVSSADFRALPLMPIWRGLLVDTAFFTGAWAAAIPAFRLARAGLRRFRHRCPRCAYVLGTAFDSGCPECGWNKPRMGAATPSPP
jgi:hypothetical protein